MSGDIRCDLAIVGGGLAGGLIAYALTVRRPDVRVLLVEPAAQLGGNHIWSFFSNDVEPEHRWIVEPFVSRSWNGYDVRFPAHQRRLGMQYNSIRSEQFDSVLRATMPEESIVTAKAVQLRWNGVALQPHRIVRAGGVIDARGPGDLSRLDVGWQKFLGQELILKAPHKLDLPVVMDADVEQFDGFRFVYSLPFGPERVFIEDTYYSDRPAINRTHLTKRIAEYAAARGWQIESVVREEAGALPVVIGGDYEAYRRSTSPGVAKVGVRAGLFHPTTGFSLPDAVRTAAFLVEQEDLSGPAVRQALRDYARNVWNERGFYRMLDTMLFRAAEPDERYKVLEHFYRLSPAIIGRFYAAQSTATDKLRVLSGRPPVPIRKAIQAIRAGMT